MSHNYWLLRDSETVTKEDVMLMYSQLYCVALLSLSASCLYRDSSTLHIHFTQIMNDDCVMSQQRRKVE